MNYKQKVLDYFAQKQKEGLIDVHFFPTEKAKGATEESLYEEIWRMINDPTVPDKEVLGKYSPNL